VSQANLHQVISYGAYTEFRREQALAAAGRAKAEVARRGLVVTVVQAYYGLIATQRKYANVQEAAKEALRFVSLSQKLENGGEVALGGDIHEEVHLNDRHRPAREPPPGQAKSPVGPV